MFKRLVAILAGLLTIGVVGVSPVAAAAPDAPTGVTGSNPTATSIDVTWSAPANDGGEAIIDYEVTATPGGATLSTPDDSTSLTFTGLTAGTAYTFTVIATNLDGDSLPSAASAAVTTLDVPGTPTSVGLAQGTPPSTQLVATWVAPADTGGSAIIDYTVELVDVVATTVVQTDTVTGLTATFSGLDASTNYQVRVSARNAVGSGPNGLGSGATAAPPAVAPGAFTVTATAATSTSANVGWTEATGNPVPTYSASISPAGPTVGAVNQAARTVSVTGMTPGVEYTITVTAANGEAPNSTASATVTTGTAPGAFTATATELTTTSASVAWTAASGDPAPTYSASVAPAGPTVGVVNQAARTVGVTGMTPGVAYTITITANNGVAPNSSDADTITLSLPAAAPGGFTVTATEASATSANFSWTDPGGNPAPSYAVVADPVGPTVTTSGRSATATGMTPGVSYTFTVTATNASGSTNAAASIAVDSPPGAPSNVAAEILLNPVRVKVSWQNSTAAATAITGYRITPTNGGAASTVIEIETDDVETSGTTISYVIPTTLDGGAYTFAVAAVNADGTGASTSSASVSVPTSPGATSIEAFNVKQLGPNQYEPEPFANYITIEWEPPTDNGGLPIESYTVQIVIGSGADEQRPAGLRVEGVAPGARTATIGPLTGGFYRAEIQAASAAGNGPTATSNQVEVRTFAPFRTTESFVRQQYRDFLGREADQGGLDFWMSRTAGDGSNIATIITAFMDSQEFAPRRSLVRLYAAYFDRDPDLEGFDYWTNELATGGARVDDVSELFSLSPEFQATYGSLDNDAFVRLVYRNVLKRDPDAAGFEYWRQQLANGLGRGRMMTAFSESPENVIATTGLVDVVVTYRGMLNRLPDTAGKAYWVGIVGGNRNALASLVQNFYVSPEYASRITP